VATDHVRAVRDERCGRPRDRAVLQNWALELQRLYRQPPAPAAPEPIRVLAFMAPGEFMANMPIGFLLAGASITLDMVYDLYIIHI